MVNFILCISYHNEKLNEGEKMRREGRGRKEGRRRKISGVEGKRRKDRQERDFLADLRLHIICRFLESLLSFSSFILKNI